MSPVPRPYDLGTALTVRGGAEAGERTVGRVVGRVADLAAERLFVAAVDGSAGLE